MLENVRRSFLDNSTALTSRRVVQGTLVVTAVVLAFYLLFRFQNVVIILVAAVMLSVALEPLVRRLEARGVAPAVTIVLFYVFVFLVIGLLLWFAAPLVIDQSSLLTRRFTDSYRELRSGLVGSNNLVISRLSRALPRVSPLLQAAPTQEDVLASLSDLMAVFRLSIRALLGIMATLLLALYWTLESRRIKHTFYLLLPARRRDGARAIVADIESKIGNYVVGQGILSLVIGVISFFAYLLIGLPNALTLAVFAGLMEAVPLIGPLIGAVPAILIAVSISPTAAIWVALATLIIQQLENNLLVPRIMSRAIGVSPLVTLLTMIGVGTLFGLTGVIIALPVAAIVQMFVERYVLSRTTADSSAGRGRASVLRYRTQDLVNDIRSQIRKKPELATAVSEQIEDSLEAIALDLDGLLAQSLNEEESAA